MCYKINSYYSQKCFNQKCINDRLKIFYNDVVKLITQFNYINTVRLKNRYQCSRLVSHLNSLKLLSRNNSDYPKMVKFFRKKEVAIYKKKLTSKISRKRYRVRLFSLKKNYNPLFPKKLNCHSFKEGEYLVGVCDCVTQQEFNILKGIREYSRARRIKEQQCRKN